MTKTEYERKRRDLWETRRGISDGKVRERVQCDILAAEAAGVVWDKEPIELPGKLFYRNGTIANFCEESPVATERHIYANINRPPEIMIEANEKTLAALQEMRWKLLAFRAEREDPGDAPVFSDPEALIKFLNAKVIDPPVRTKPSVRFIKSRAKKGGPLASRIDTAAALHALCATYNAWGPEGTLREKLARMRDGMEAVGRLGGWVSRADELLVEPWKEA